MKTQLFIGSEPKEEKFEEVENREFPHAKCEGGFWTSSLDEDGECGWVKWTRRNSFSTHGVEVQVWKIVPEEDLDIYVINSLEDLLDLVDEYGFQDHPVLDREEGFSHKYPDWEAVSEDYDAVRLTSKGQTETRMPRMRSKIEGLEQKWEGEFPPDLYGWDCESTLWFSWKFKTIERFGLYTQDREVEKNGG